MAPPRRVAPMPADWPAVRAFVLAEEKYTCRQCSGRATDVDHIIPACDGGTDDRSNLQALCGSCHRTKTGKDAARNYWKRRRRQPPRHPGRKRG